MEGEVDEMRGWEREVEARHSPTTPFALSGPCPGPCWPCPGAFEYGGGPALGVGGSFGVACVGAGGPGGGAPGPSEIDWWWWCDGGRCGGGCAPIEGENGSSRGRAGRGAGGAEVGLGLDCGRGREKGGRKEV